MAKDRSFYYPREVAALFGVTVQTVRAWANEGKIPHSKTFGGGQLRFNKTVIDKLVEEAGVNVHKETQESSDG